jgi:cobalt-precorrin 5A hydrolase/precorrin-3B C17-methyltransferase
MASPVLDMAATTADFAAVEVEVIPGVTAGLAAAALLGAPLGHDHLVISLSDLLTPWERIEARLRAAAEADLVLVVYNPRSQRRTWQIDQARTILVAHRSPDTPVGVVTDVARAGQHVELTTLGALDTTTVTMTTCLVIGSSATQVKNGRMVTPRGYVEPSAS